ncbi:uncharacterized protein DS421_16g556170 [Arachis hypogaea]|nr:uncharacterized protein DS421_16g556170 [Arachis hypogaea]
MESSYGARCGPASTFHPSPGYMFLYRVPLLTLACRMHSRCPSYTHRRSVPLLPFFALSRTTPRLTSPGCASCT